MPDNNWAPRIWGETPQQEMVVDFSGLKTTRNRPYDADSLNYIYGKLREAGLDNMRIAAILGTIAEESGGDPYAVSDDGSYEGLLQWADNRYHTNPLMEYNPRRETDRQVSYIINTLNNSTDTVSWTHGGKGSGYQRGVDAMNDFATSEDLQQVVHALNRGYVRPTGKDDSVRNRYNVASQIYERINNPQPVQLEPVVRQNADTVTVSAEQIIQRQRPEYYGLLPIQQEQEPQFYDVESNLYAEGGGIHIKPSHRGRFTALLERTGKSASWYKENGTPAQRKMATFALNARKWKHGEGGELVNAYPNGGKIRDGIKKVLSTATKVPVMTGTATGAATGLRDIPLTGSTVGRELAVAGAAIASPAVPSLVPVVMNPLSATTRLGAAVGTLADATGFVTGAKELADDASKAIHGNYTLRDVPKTMLDATVLVPGSSAIMNPRNLAHLKDAGAAIANIPNITSVRTLGNRIVHPEETYRYAGLSRKAKSVLPDDVYDATLKGLKKTWFDNVEHKDYKGLTFAILGDGAKFPKKKGDYAVYGLGLKDVTDDFGRAHELGHLVQDVAEGNTIYQIDNTPVFGYDYGYAGKAPELERKEYFADVFGNSITKDATLADWTNKDYSDNSFFTKTFRNSRYPYIFNEKPEFSMRPYYKSRGVQIQ